MNRFNINDVARFAEGVMVKEEHDAFASELHTNEQLRAELSYYNHVHFSLQIKLTEDANDRMFKTSLAKISRRHFHKTATIISFRNIAAWTSAVAAVFIVLIIWAPWSKNLYKEYSSTKMISVAERSGNQVDKFLLEADKAFNKKDFNTSKKRLQHVVELDPENSTAQYYYGISLLETNEIQKSRDVFTQIYTNESIFKYDAAFYMALSYLKEKDEKTCRDWLKKIPEEATIYPKSKELLEKLSD